MKVTLFITLIFSDRTSVGVVNFLFLLSRYFSVSNVVFANPSHYCQCVTHFSSVSKKYPRLSTLMFRPSIVFVGDDILQIIYGLTCQPLRRWRGLISFNVGIGSYQTLFVFLNQVRLREQEGRLLSLVFLYQTVCMMIKSRGCLSSYGAPQFSSQLD